MTEVKSLDYIECKELCKDIRREIINTVSKNGGHLASNLGTVELTVALHRNFNSPQDKIVFDVGHQCYTHKILTGRDFSKLRQKDGISGFQNPDESEHDPFITGHSSTSVSVVCGLLAGMRLNGDNHYAIAVVGDGAMTGGMFYEGLNNAGQVHNSNLIVILNHNGVSISKNVGAIAKYLKKIRHSEDYVIAKKSLENVLNKTPVFGRPLIKVLKTSKDMIKEFVHLTNMFENMGFVYLGPVDGHNMEELDKVLQTAKTYHHPVFIHVNTVKGKGYKFAQENPGEYHGVACFNPKVGTKETWKKECFSCAFGDILVKFSKSDKNICAITAAMKYGVGLQSFCREFPSRFFDVGIAEQHAVTFAAALAKSGKTPVFAVYASFLQRAYDQLIHDVTLQNLHIVLAVDRFGVVGSDGETHQGTFIMNMLMGIPNVTIFTPCNYQELEEHLYKAIYEVKGIAAVCYPRGKEQLITPLPTDKNEDTAVITYGRMYTELSQRMNNVYTCHDILYPVQESFITQFLSKKHILFIEEMYETGGYGDYFHLQLIHRGYTGTFRKKALPAIIKQAPPSFIFSSLLDTGTAVIEVP